MTEEILAAIKVVVAYLDSEMESAPNRELADASNFLQGILDDNE